MAMPAAGLLFPGTTGAPPIFAATRALGPTAPAPARVRLPAAALRIRTARVQLRCARTDDLDAVTEEDIASLPAWAPSVEEIIEFNNTDFSPEAIQERFVRESKPAAAAVKGAVAGLLLRPLRELVDDLRKLKTVYDTEEFHIGLPVGAFMACVGLYHLWKAAPSACLNFALSYAFYRLSVMAAEVRRKGFATDLIIRIKLVIIIAMLIKDFSKTIAFLDYVRCALFFVYFFSVGWEIKGLKKYGRYLWPILIDSFTTPQGRRELLDSISEIDFDADEDEW